MLYQEEIGINIYSKIYKKAKPYLNTRQNDIHISISYSFARRLLRHYNEASADIVLPGILLHDVGWKIVPEDKQLNAFGPKATDNETLRIHEVEGARIAAEILNSINYNEEKIREIVTIIDGHDSRNKALSLNDALVKDADKLFRYTLVGVNIDCVRLDLDRDSHTDWLAFNIDRWFFTTGAKDMAREVLGETSVALRQKQ